MDAPVRSSAVKQITVNTHLIIGIGNPLRGDDGLGWAAVEALQRLLPPDNVECICVQQLTMDLVENLNQVQQVTFIDARAGDPPGERHSSIIAADSALEAASSHFFDPQTLLAAVQALYGRHPAAMLHTINAASFDYGASLSAVVKAGVKELVTEIAGKIEEKQPA